MLLIDTHTHLFLEQFIKDREFVIERALKEGVTKMILPNIDNSTIAPMLSLCDTYPAHCFPTIGLHPSSVKNDFEKELEQIEKELTQKTYYAIGETGMDLYWDKTFYEQQKEAFSFQIELAKRNDLPIIIHSRNAFDELFSIMDTLNDTKLKGVFHCFSGDIEQAKKIISYGGFKLGIGGVVTFRNSGLDEVVKQIDLKHLVLETDSPYLAPIPHRGQRNESSYLRFIAQKIAELTNNTLEKVASITTLNANTLFSL